MCDFGFSRTVARLSGAGCRRFVPPRVCALLLALCSLVAGEASAADALYHHVHLIAPAGDEGALWYIKHMECEAVPNRPNAAQCGSTLFLFLARQPKGPSEGSGVDHIGFSFHGLPAKVTALEAAGVKVTSAVRDVPGLFKVAFVEDPWGTRIELVEDHEYPGFHHVHLSTADPARTLGWYQNVFGGERTRMKGQLDSVLYGGKVWLLAMRAREAVAGTDGRVIDHLGFGFADLDTAAAEIKQKGITFDQEPRAIDGPTSSAKISFINGPDAVRIEVVEPRK